MECLSAITGIRTVQETGEQLLSVLFNIFEGNKIVHTARHGFPLDIGAEALEVELKRELDRFAADEKSAAHSAEFAAKDAKADATIAAVMGREIKN